jgi:gamma-D-glutamyl-L-lysine dipeptidyl-peptidase
LYTATGEETGFQRIKTEYDRYEGWMDKRHGARLSMNEFEEHRRAPAALSLTLAAFAKGDESTVLVPRGGRLPWFDGQNFKLGGKRFMFEGSVVQTVRQPDLGLLEPLAESYMDCPYRWGGRSPWGLDCSGFTQVLFKLIGVHLLRDTSEQINQGELVERLDAARKGDLFFGINLDSNERHVGVILDGLTVVHASGKVRKDKLTEDGLYNFGLGRLTYRTEMIRRVL